MLHRFRPYRTLTAFCQRLLETAPFNEFYRKILKLCPTTALTKVKWEMVDRPHYLLGVYRAAEQAQAEGIREISVVEFGVACGAGLMLLQDFARQVEAETNVSIKVIGFDSGSGLPELSGDHRDHPDAWLPMDYPMNVQSLRQRLTSRTELVLGDVKTTVPEFVARGRCPPIGFIAFDLDLHSSTKHALRVLSAPNRIVLRRVFLYFDDVDLEFNHRYAGELLAIDEFNDAVTDVKIDRWRGVEQRTVFTNSAWIKKMYIAHDLTAISRVVLTRAHLHLGE
jgi:hypothetical protein